VAAGGSVVTGDVLACSIQHCVIVAGRYDVDNSCRKVDACVSISGKHVESRLLFCCNF